MSTHPCQRVPTGKPYRPIASVRMASSFSNLSFLDFLIAVRLAEAGRVDQNVHHLVLIRLGIAAGEQRKQQERAKPGSREQASECPHDGEGGGRVWSPV